MNYDVEKYLPIPFKDRGLAFFYSEPNPESKSRVKSTLSLEHII